MTPTEPVKEKKKRNRIKTERTFFIHKPMVFEMKRPAATYSNNSPMGIASSGM